MSFKVAVYCGSSRNAKGTLLESAFDLGYKLAAEKIDLIYGGGMAGMMGALANGALTAKGKVTGVIPKFLQDLELGHSGIDQLIEVDTMHTRQRIMMMQSDCIVALPGGSGTFAELFEAIAWRKLGLITSPIILANYESYFDNLLKQTEVSVEAGFMHKHSDSVWFVVKDVDETVNEILKIKKKYE